MKKTDKYFILHKMPSTERGLIDWLSEIENWEKKILPKINPKDTYLLLEKSCYKNENGTDEYYTNAFSFSGDEKKLYKITKKWDIYDYTGISFVIIHHKEKLYSFNDWTKLTIEERKK